MQKRFYLYQRGGVYYMKDSLTGKQESLKTKEKTEAQRLFHAKIEAQAQPSLNLQIARTYLMAADPATVLRSWQTVFEEIFKAKQGETRIR